MSWQAEGGWPSGHEWGWCSRARPPGRGRAGLTHYPPNGRRHRALDGGRYDQRVGGRSAGERPGQAHARRVEDQHGGDDQPANLSAGTVIGLAGLAGLDGLGVVGLSEGSNARAAEAGARSPGRCAGGVGAFDRAASLALCHHRRWPAMEAPSDAHDLRFASSQPQLGCAEQAVNHVVRRTEWRYGASPSQPNGRAP